jgi:hypothetical protein
VDRLGVGIDDEANLNATSSLSDRPAGTAPKDKGISRVA